MDGTESPQHEAAASVVRSRKPGNWKRQLSVLRILMWIAIGVILFYGRAAFMPVVLAVLFSLLLTTPVESLHRRGVPRGVGTILILVIFFAVVGGAINLVWTPAQSWWDSAPQTVATIERKLRPMTRAFERIEVLADRATQISPPAPGRRDAVGIRAAPSSSAPAAAPTALSILHGTGSVAINIVTVTIVTILLLAGGPPMFARMSSALGSDLQVSHMLRLIHAVRHEVSRYYATIAVINICLGVATATVTKLLGMPNPLLWGAIAALFNFVPYLGSATTLLLLSVVAIVSFDSPGRIAAVSGSYLALATLEGQLVQPLLVGRRLELNPLVVFLTLWFGGWFWGVGGVIIAVPTLVVLKVVAEFRHTWPLQEFLSPNELHHYHPKQLSSRLRMSRPRPRAAASREAGKP